MHSKKKIINWKKIAPNVNIFFLLADYIFLALIYKC